MLDLPKVRLFETGGDRYEAEREQWEDGNNVLALAPGVVVAYERNVETNTRLRHDGIQVITIEGSELGRSRAGPRRMSCAIERAEVCAATAALVLSPETFRSWATGDAPRQGSWMSRSPTWCGCSAARRPT